MARLRPIVIGLPRSTGETADGNQSVRASTVEPEVQTRWQAAASPGGLIGVLGIVLSTLLAGAMLLLVTGHASLPVPSVVAWLGLIAFVALVVALSYLVYGYVTISYDFSPEHLVIRWANQEHVINLAAVQQILPAVDRLGDHPTGWRRFWTGYYVGSEPSPTGEITVVSTLPVQRQLLIVTADRQFAISPERPVLFVEEYGRLRQALESGQTGEPTGFGPGESVERLAEAGWTMQYPAVKLGDSVDEEFDGVDHKIFNDRARPSRPAMKQQIRPHVLNDNVALSLLGTAVLLNVAMVLFILIRYSSLPPSIALHWNVNGDPDRIGSPRGIWVIPIITASVAIANFIFAWSIETFDRFAARFLLAASCLVQVVAWIALITLIQ
jgi:hypothetical protein